MSVSVGFGPENPTLCLFGIPCLGSNLEDKGGSAALDRPNQSAEPDPEPDGY